MISLSRLIKSQWSTANIAEKKIISIRNFNIVDYAADIPEIAVEEEHHETPIELIEKANKEAEKIIQSAQKKQEDLLRQIQQERESWNTERELLINEAKKAGYQVGWNEGQQEGFSQYQEYIVEAQEVIQAAKKDYISYLETSEQTILDLATAIAEKVVASKIEEDGGYFLSLVKKAIKDVKEYQDVQIHVNPKQYHFLLENKEELLAVFSHETNLFIYPDHDINEGSCIIESPNGRIDASIDTQLAEIKKKLNEYLVGEAL
jgi:flagellar assembly protein FliH